MGSYAYLKKHLAAVPSKYGSGGQQNKNVHILTYRKSTFIHSLLITRTIDEKSSAFSFAEKMIVKTF